MRTGEIIKEKNGWRILRDNFERKIWKKPKYYYEVQYEENGKFVESLGTFSLREARGHFDYQANEVYRRKVEEAKR